MTRKEWVKQSIKQIVAALLFYSGVNKVYSFFARRNQLLVLMYHRVIDLEAERKDYIQPGMYVTKETFAMQMNYLSEYYDVITLEEFIEAVKTRDRIKSNACVITFDDGWRDTYTQAFPILKEYNLPATVFLVSEYVGTNRWFWTERVSYLLVKYLQTMGFKESRPAFYPALARIDFFSLTSKRNLVSEEKIELIIEKMKQLKQDEREKAIKEMEDLLKDDLLSDSSERLLMNWGEIKEMSRFRITFGSHTKRHVLLTKVTKRDAIEEIVESKQEIEKCLAKPCQAFCYPNGDHDDQVKETVKEHYISAVTTQHGFVKPGDDLFGLKRIGIHNDISFTKAMFACRTSGILDLLSL